MSDAVSNRFARLSQGLVDASPDALIAMSPAGDIRFWNNGAERIFGYSSQEAIGRTIFDLIVPAERVDETCQAVAATLESGASAHESVADTIAAYIERGER